LLICLIFFLYNEGVKDEGLFFALILLLLTWIFLCYKYIKNLFISSSSLRILQF
jgi:hypothetical protein